MIEFIALIFTTWYIGDMIRGMIGYPDMRDDWDGIIISSCFGLILVVVWLKFIVENIILVTSS